MRLIAVVQVDMVDSTGYLLRSGAQSAMERQRRLVGIVSEVAKEHSGRVLTTEGDGAIAAFPSTSNALHATVAIRLESSEASQPGDEEISLRISIMLVESGERDGLQASDDVVSGNLNNMCPPGSIVVSTMARRSARGLKGFIFSASAHAPVTSAQHPPFHELLAIPQESLSPHPSLGVVLFTDVATPGHDQDDVRRLSSDAILAHHGDIFDTNGAGHSAVFRSCTDAVAAAAAIREAANSRRLRSDTEESFDVLVGMSLGDLVGEEANGSEAYGLAVIESARLLALGKATDSHHAPTLASADVATLAHAENTSLGSHQLKNIDDDVHVVSIEHGDGVAPLAPLPASLRRYTSFPLVGRDSATTNLDALWAKAESGHVSAAIISGEEGAGKTRLVQELAQRVHSEGALVLHGACEEDLAIAYGPINAALGLATEATDELADIIGDVDDLGSDVNQRDLFDRVAITLRRLSIVRPTLLVVDDVQWADSDTLAMLTRLFTHEEPGRLAIIATCRSEHLERDQPAYTLLAAQRRNEPITHLKLSRLMPDDITEMLRHRAGTSAAGEAVVASQLMRVTGGSPLYVEQLMTHLISNEVLLYDDETGWAFANSDQSLDLPDSVVDLMQRRAQRLGPHVVELLTTAAVMGTSFDIEVLATVSKKPLGDVLDIIDTTTTARLTVENDDGDSYAFSDELIRESMLRELRTGRRALIHEQVAIALEQLRPHDIDRLASHWAAAVGSAARERAIHYHRLVGDRCLTSAAWESAAEKHQAVLDLLDNTEDHAGIAEAQYRVGLAHRKLGQATHRPLLIKAAAIARRIKDGDLLARCAAAMMRPGAWYPEAEVVDTELVDMCRDALLLLEASDPQRARVLASLAVNLTFGASVEERTALIDEAQQIATASGDHLLRGTVLAAELITFPQPDRFERRRQLAEEIRSIGRATGERDLFFVGSWFIVLDLVATGNIEEASRIVAELRELVDDTREYWPAFLVSHFETALAIARCDPSAPELIDQTRDRFMHQPVDWFGVSVIQHATVALGHGTLSDMVLPLLEAADEHGSEEWAMKWNYALSRAHLDGGDPEAAATAIAMNPELDLDYYWLASTYHLGLLGLQLRNREICNEVIRKLTVFRGRIIMIGLGACISGQVSTALGQAHLGLGNYAMANELFREAAEQAERAGWPYFATHARRFLATSLLEEDAASPEAKAILQEVVARSQELDFAIELREAASLLVSFDAGRGVST